MQHNFEKWCKSKYNWCDKKTRCFFIVSTGLHSQWLKLDHINGVFQMDPFWGCKIWQSHLIMQILWGKAAKIFYLVRSTCVIDWLCKSCGKTGQRCRRVQWISSCLPNAIHLIIFCVVMKAACDAHGDGDCRPLCPSVALLLWCWWVACLSPAKICQVKRLAIDVCLQLVGSRLQLTNCW